MAGLGVRPLFFAIAVSCVVLRGVTCFSIAQERPRRRPSAQDSSQRVVDELQRQNQLLQQDRRGAREQTALSVAVFAQVANFSIWPDLLDCIGTVAAAAHDSVIMRPVDVHVALTSENEGLDNDIEWMRGRPGLSKVYVNIVKNRGADIGEFMQQLLYARANWNSFRYDVILKIHSKSSRGDWRHRMLNSVCGDQNQVTTIVSKFAESPNLGIVGPYKLIWSWYTPSENVFAGLGEYGFRMDDMESKMNNTWRLIYPAESLPPRESYLVSGGSMFYARPEPFLSEELQRAIPKFLDMWKDGYDPNCTSEACSHMFALERVIPTIIHGRYGLDYDQTPMANRWRKWPVGA